MLLVSVLWLANAFGVCIIIGRRRWYLHYHWPMLLRFGCGSLVLLLKVLWGEVAFNSSILPPLQLACNDR